MIRRETFIALRARRTAYRIANQILHPPFEPDPPPVLPLIEYQTPSDPTLDPHPRFYDRPSKAIWICFWLAFFWIVAFTVLAVLLDCA